jgi:AAA domain
LSITADANVYFCPNLASGRGVPGEAEVTRLYAMAVDIDPLDTTNDAAWNTERKRIRIIVHDAIHGALPPSYVINTGNGAQLVYFINSIENTPENRVRYLMVIKALSRRVGGDPALTHRVSSLFRVPGTHNVPSQTKRNKGRKAVPGSVWFASERRYDLDDLFAAVAGDAPEPEPERTAASIDGLSFDMLVEAHAKLDPAIETVIRERIERFESFARLHAEVASGKGGEEKNRSKADFRYCVALIEAGMALAAVACALAHYGAQKREMGTANWEKYIIDTVLNAKVEARKPAEEWYDPSGDEDMEQQQGTPDDRPWKLATEMANTPRASNPLVKKLIVRNGIGMLYGATNTGKSLVLMHLCACLTSGQPFAGYKTKSKGICVYVAMEGGGGVPDRIRAHQQQYPDWSIDRLVFLPLSYNLNAAPATDDNKNDLARNAKALQKQLRNISKQLQAPIDMVVIDTLVIASAGADENNVADMGRVLHHIRKFLVEPLNTFVMLAHHSGKDPRRGARGSTVMPGDVEVEMAIAAQGKVGSMRVTKLREFAYDPARPHPYLILSHKVGTDEDGDPVTGGVVTMLETPERAGQAPPTEKEQEIIDAMRDLRDPVSVRDIADHLKVGAEAIRRIVAKLHSHGIVYEVTPGKVGVGGYGATYSLWPTDYDEEQTDEHNDPFA